MRWRRGFGLAVRLGARPLGRGQQMAGALDVVGTNAAGEQAVMADDARGSAEVGSP